MSENYDGNPDNYPVHTRLVQDGEPAAQAFLALADQDLADRTANLNARIVAINSAVSTPISNTNLKAIDTTTTSAGTVQNTVDGLYRFVATSPPSDVANAFPWLVAPTTGPGTWVLESWVTDLGTMTVGVRAIPQGITFVDNSDPPNGEMGGPTQFGLGAVGPDSFTPGIFALQSTGFVALDVNDDSGLDGGPGLGSHYGTTIDLTGPLAPYIGLRIVSVVMHITGAIAYTSMPNVVPALGVVTFDPTTGLRSTLAASDGPARDTSGTVSAYKTKHTLTYACNQNNRIGASSTQARIYIEGGNHATAGTFFEGFAINLSVF